jgi:PAS domain S-box-containing protein
MLISDDPFFNAFFNGPVPRLILKAESPDFTILEYNHAFSVNMRNQFKDLDGQSLFDIFHSRAAAEKGRGILLDALHSSMESKSPVTTSAFRYEAIEADGVSQEINWWQMEIIPVLAKEGEVSHLLLSAVNVNNQIEVEATLTQREDTVHQLNKELSITIADLRQSQRNLEQLNLTLEDMDASRVLALRESETSLRNLVMSVHYPLMLLRGRDWVVEIANQKLVELWNKTLPEVIGRRLMNILPEIKDQPFPKLLTQVYDTALPYGQEEEVLVVNTDEGPLEKYISFYYDPLFDSNGDVSGIIVAAEDITAKVQARTALEESYRKQQELNEEVSVVNEELYASNEELIATNEELISIERNLQDTVVRLAQSESRIRYMVADAPVAIGLFTGQDLIIETANNKILELWGKNSSVLGMRLEEALPELAGQPFLKLLLDVFHSGEPFYGNEIKANLAYNGVLKDVYFNFVYHPIKQESGETVSILAVAIDVTEQVQARQLVEASATRFRFLLNAIPQQVWTSIPEGELDYVNQVVCRDFGKTDVEIVDQGWRAFIHPEDSDNFLEHWHTALRSGREFQVEFRLRFKDGSYVWHLSRALPLIEDGEIKLWLGTNTNIDLQKNDAQRKDEFLSIASHELKTPLTSIKAYNQLISRSKDSVQMQGFVSKSAEHIVKLERLIADLLDVTKINAGKLNFSLQPFNFRQMLEESVEGVQHTTSSHKIILESAVDIVYNGDPFRLEQVMNNFLTNAIKYSPSAERVLVNCKVEFGNLIVSVQDFGIGIAEESLDKLFDRYYRVDNTSMRFEGLGLGLFISSEILKRHQGSFWIESEEGKGSTFYFRLPLNQADGNKYAHRSNHFYQDDSITVKYNSSKNRLDVNWTGFQDLGSVKNGGMMMLEILSKNGADKLLNDNREVLGTWSEAADWAGKEWMPMIEQAGLKYFAWIFSSSAFSQMSAKKSINVMQGNVVTRFFTDIAEAEAWLDQVGTIDN